ncbi:hypothetical protein ACFS2C_28085 [Prauserella oleivorans]|uniref:Uncharacterized protein n=1 Tax=Prauserella oleivorans TaxID=1478153 RepID=A0ABW5WJH6_9PSEU
MAGHHRTVATGKARRTGSGFGRVRQIREHLPPGEAATNRRRKLRAAARAIANQRINVARDPLVQLEAARDYVRSAAAKYQHDTALQQAVDALLAIGDQIYRDGTQRRRG